jgi:hypothetical protein
MHRTSAHEQLWPVDNASHGHRPPPRLGLSRWFVVVEVAAERQEWFADR